MYNELLNNLLINNKIDEKKYSEIVYKTLINGLFEYIVKEIGKKGDKKRVLLIYQNYKSDIIATKIIIASYVKCNLTDDEIFYIANLLKNFLRKDSKRKPPSMDQRIKLLEEQDYKCAICHSCIDIKTSHYDHIVPFKHVGDELLDNYQMLCETCNERKSDSIYYQFANLIVKK